MSHSEQRDSPQDEKARGCIGKRTREWLIFPTVCPALLKHQIELAGVSIGREGMNFNRISPYFSVVMVCLNGRACIQIEGKWQVMHKGMAFLSPPHVPHAYYVEKRRHWTVAWLRYVQPEDQAPIVSLPAPKLIHADPRPLHSQIMGLYYESSHVSDLNIMEQWVALIDAYARRLFAPIHVPDRLWEFWSKVTDNLGHPWTLERLSHAANTNPETLRQLCQQQYGRSPMEHLTWLRMRHAAGLLGSTGDKIEVIARLVGYASLTAFSAVFRRVMGMPPSSFRKRRQWSGD